MMKEGQGIRLLHRQNQFELENAVHIGIQFDSFENRIQIK